MKGKMFFRTTGGSFFLRTAFVAWACVAALSACTSNKREPLPDWSSGYEPDAAYNEGQDGGVPAAQSDGGSVPPRNFPEDSFGVGIPVDVTYPIRIRKLNTSDKPCAVKQGSSDADIMCIMDMDELDLYYLGLKYDIVAPSGMCDFVRYSSYLFENFPVGEGPKEVSWTVDRNGNIIKEVNAVDGKPRCDLDFSWQYPESDEAPNCCYGTYTRRVTTVSDKDGGAADIKESQENWGGPSSYCFSGAAFLDKKAEFTEDGWPTRRFIYVDRDQLFYTVEYRYLSQFGYGTNVVLANYYDLADHSNDMPAALKANDLADVVQPYYEIECVDDAEEIIARVRLVVREWNEEAQFDMNGDPDTHGVEPYWDTPIDDIPDWAIVTPGNDTYPMIFPTGKPD